ncbi:DUF3800 domain-containing protein [Methylorubrum sp. SB2]|uniref:DUF3800 domain-containing protein n=1 Tax=Methylorubrum subtropicum TaxID=3138812 RepID=UPI00313DC352
MPTSYRIYIDDSGNVDPGATNDPNQRYGSISAVILPTMYIDETFNPSFLRLIEKHFGTKPNGSPHNVHRRLLNCPPDHGPFSVLKDEAKRVAWNSAALSMSSKAEYTLITACVDKVEWYWRYPTWSGDFYQVLVTAVLERAYYFLHNREGIAEVNVETKNPSRDQRLKDSYKQSLTDGGFQHISAHKLRSVFQSINLNILHKEDCACGLQLADLIAAPALQLIRFQNTNRHPIQSEFVRALCAILEGEKFYREGSRGPDGFGKLWRPQRSRRS